MAKCYPRVVVLERRSKPAASTTVPAEGGSHRPAAAGRVVCTGAKRGNGTVTKIEGSKAGRPLASADLHEAGNVYRLDTFYKTDPNEKDA
jgi:hypothetical protein